MVLEHTTTERLTPILMSFSFKLVSGQSLTGPGGAIVVSDREGPPVFAGNYRGSRRVHVAEGGQRWRRKRSMTVVYS
jgi:hypothetical protein